MPTTSVGTDKKSYTGAFPTLPTSNANASKINAQALAIAWPKGTSSKKWKYSTGGAVAAFKAAITKAYPNRSNWSKATKAGASCDVFAGTVIRSCGVDRSMPRGLEQQFPYLAKAAKWTSIASPTKNTIKAGDVIIYYKKSGGAHIAIVVSISGKLYISEAGYQSSYGHITNTASSRVSMTNKKKRYVYRAKESGYGSLRKGNKSDNVKKLQAFLNWYGGYGLKVDGEFGTKTEIAVKNFQNKEGLTVDGQFGKLSLGKSKAVMK